jgi:hypothetical protein
MAYGTVNADVIQTSTSGGILGAGNASIMKNRIINGAMVIDQRNAGASVSSGFSVDRFGLQFSSASKFTAQQNAGSVTPPTGFSYYLGCTSSAATSLGASDYYGIYQNIEGFNFSDCQFGTASAKTINLSFQVYSSLTGTFGGALRNSANNRSYPFTYTISSANTWTTASITIAGDTSGTWVGATNGIGIAVLFSLGTGSTLSGTAGAWAGANYLSATGATSVVGTSGATFYITGVQLEVGSSATGFEYRHYTQDLILCQRYCYVNTAVYDSYSWFGTGLVVNSADGRVMVYMPVTLRSSPTLTTSGNLRGYDGSTASATTSVAIANTGNQVIQIDCPNGSGWTTGRAFSFGANNDTSAKITLSAEL